MSTSKVKEDTRTVPETKIDVPRPVTHLTLEERATKGREARATAGRKSHAAWEPRADRPDPVELLEDQAKTRVPELVPIRYGRMLVSPFTFYRGAAYLMASDLSRLPNTGLNAQLCGDAHLSNFGGFAAPDRRLVFDTNDFDETHPGPFEWDLKRLAASFEVAARDRGFDEAQREQINLQVGSAYRAAMTSFASMGTMDIWYSRVDIDDYYADYQARLGNKAAARAEKTLAKARTKDSLAAFNKLTRTVDGEPRIVSDPPLIVPIADLMTNDQGIEAARIVVRNYRKTLAGDRRKLLERFRLVDAARKVVGVGSVGTRAYILLFLGRDNGDPLFLQMKEAQRSVLEPFLGQSEFSNHGQRVVEGQRLMQAASDTMLGWIRTVGIDGEERDFYMRQLWDAKGSARVDLMEPATMVVYAEVCAQTLARAHARSGDSVAISSYLGTGDAFDRALAAFAAAYADQNERDYEALKEAAASGRVTVEAGL